MNRLTSAGVDYSFDNAGTLTVQYGYDAASNRTSMTDPQNLPTRYGYDTLNRLTSLAFNGQNPGFGFGYDTLSRRRVDKHEQFLYIQSVLNVKIWRN